MIFCEAVRLAAAVRRLRSVHERPAQSPRDHQSRLHCDSCRWKTRVFRQGMCRGAAVAARCLSATRSPVSVVAAPVFFLRKRRDKDTRCPNVGRTLSPRGTRAASMLMRSCVGKHLAVEAGVSAVLLPRRPPAERRRVDRARGDLARRDVTLSVG